MTDNDSIRKFEDMLRDHPGATFAFLRADDLICEDRFAVGLPTSAPLPLRAGYGGGKAWGYARTLDSAYYIARARIDDIRVAA